ncbi:MAG: polysaccharide deacetylase family protein [Deltaproteobacteria bacterium]|nr:polysaccharide deacetylase family protein [Deltaproteobacteria bacterium]
MSIPNILTIDVEDWFHICGIENQLPESAWNRLEARVLPNTRKILDLLHEFRARATFFVLGYVAEREPDLIREIKARGHEIATHGFHHRRVYTQSPDQFREDLVRALEVLSEITGSPAEGFRAPEWSIRDDSLWALEILAGEGIRYDSSMAPLPVIGNPSYPTSPHRRMTRVGALWEFPPLVRETPFLNLPIGGGWGLRVFPYSLIRAAIRGLNRRGYPAVIFLHPREFDPRPPRIPLPLSRRFVLNARVKSTPERMRRLLEDFSFTSVEGYLEGLEMKPRLG